MGIMRSVKSAVTDTKSAETVQAILACIQVASSDQYEALCDTLSVETNAIQCAERLEIEKNLFRSDVHSIHDRYAMVIFRVQDDEGHPVADFDLVLTAGPDADPNHLPQGFFVDRQRNSLNPETLTYYFNCDVMKGTAAVVDTDGNVIRDELPGAGMLGFKIIARPDGGFVHYLPCEIETSPDMLGLALHANSTTLVDIVLRRIVRKNAFSLQKVTGDTKARSFKNTRPGEGLLGKRSFYVKYCQQNDIDFIRRAAAG